MKKRYIFGTLIVVTMISVMFDFGQATDNNGVLSLPLSDNICEINISTDEISGSIENGISVTYQDNLPIWEEIEKRLNVDIIWETVPMSQYNIVMQLRIATGAELPDIMKVPGTVIDAMTYADQGVLYRLTELIEDYAPDIQRLFANNASIRKGSVAEDGEIYFLPNYVEGIQNGRSFVIREDWLELLEIDAPQNISEWKQTLIMFRDRSVELSGNKTIVPLNTDWQGLLNFVSGFGMPVEQNGSYFWFDDNGLCRMYCLCDGYKDWLEFCNELYMEGLLGTYFGYGIPVTDELIAKNEVGCIIEYTGVAEEKDVIAHDAGYSEANFVWILPPVDDLGYRTWFYQNPCRNTERHGITRDCVNLDVAMGFLDYVYASEEGTRLTLCGVEGEQYYIVDGKLTFDSSFFEDPNCSFNQKLRNIGLFDYMDIQTAEFNSARITGKFQQYIELIKNCPDCKEGMPVLLPGSNERRVLEDKWPMIQCYIDDMTLQFIMGKKPITEYDDFAQNLYELGIQEIVDIYTDLYASYQI